MSRSTVKTQIAKEVNEAGWWGISVGITILKNCGVKRTKLKKTLSKIIDYIYMEKGEDI